MPDHVNTRHEREWPDSILHKKDQYHQRAELGHDRAIVAITMLIEVVAYPSAPRFSFGGEGRGCCTPNFLWDRFPRAKDDKKALPWQEVPDSNCERRNVTLSNALRPQSQPPATASKTTEQKRAFAHRRSYRRSPLGAVLRREERQDRTPKQATRDAAPSQNVWMERAREARVRGRSRNSLKSSLDCADGERHATIRVSGKAGTMPSFLDLHNVER
jgi:hypothetical protein